MPNARVKEWEVAGVPCLVVVANRAMDENEEVTLDLGYQLEVPNTHVMFHKSGLL